MAKHRSLKRSRQRRSRQRKSKRHQSRRRMYGGEIGILDESEKELIMEELRSKYTPEELISFNLMGKIIEKFNIINNNAITYSNFADKTANNPGIQSIIFLIQHKSAKELSDLLETYK